MNVIEINSLTKVYRLYKSPRDRLIEIISLNTKIKHHDFYALKDVSLTVEKGMTVGMIGQNGSGKSTLLKIITGVNRPTSGSVKVNGRISSLLELGAGFQPDFTGRENVYMNGALMGFSREEMESRFSEIEAFADIGEFIDQPVKNYSSGMYIRLAFAAAINVNPDILIIDEVLSVGDVFFQTKCFSKFQEFKKKEVTIIFVTHSLDLIATHCNYAILLDKGRLIEQGNPKDVINEYRMIASTKEDYRAISSVTEVHSDSTDFAKPGPFLINLNHKRYGTKRAEILEAGIFTTDDQPVQILERNQEYLIKIKVRHNEDMPAPIISFVVTNSNGTILCGTNTAHQNIDIGSMQKGDIVMVIFRQVFRLNSGEYLLTLTVQAVIDGEMVAYDRLIDYMSFQVVSNKTIFGIFDNESNIEWFYCK